MKPNKKNCDNCGALALDIQYRCSEHAYCEKCVANNQGIKTEWTGKKRCEKCEMELLSFHYDSKNESWER